MNTKLTLNLKEAVIERAKQYAKSQNTSLSRIIENFLQNLTDTENEKDEISPLVKSLSGVIKLPEDFDHKTAYTEHLTNKYR